MTSYKSHVMPTRKLNFLDVTIINTGAGKYEFKIHRKNAITNVQIKPH